MKHMIRVIFLLLLCPAGQALMAQSTEVYPTHWWTGMQWNKVQLMVHSPGAGFFTTARTSFRNVQITKVTKAESPNYCFVDMVVFPSARPGNFQITLSGPGNTPPLVLDYSLKARRPGRGTQFAKGVTASDFVYLLMPDRFANGDPSNDRIPGYKDTIADRLNPSAHHGGDIQGVINSLPYLKDLGVTSVWMCPVTENDMPWKQEPSGAISGYHGYWITNHYKIDKRYGGNEAYHKLTSEAHARGMKVIQDAVYNHIGDEHFLFKDMPFKDMINHWPGYTGSNHRDEAVFSPYKSQTDNKVMLDGWFTPHLPDVNLRNPYMATFMIQNALWCTEEFGVDAWRVDTYKYCDETFMNKVNDALLKEYPSLTIFGEAWCNTVTGSAYFARNNMKVPFKHNLQGVTDFPMQGAMVAAVNEPFGWSNGVNRLYTTLSQDMLYDDPKRNCIFLDNHDMDRFLTMINGDVKKYKMGIGLLLTQRGIPQLYYGTEILMKNDNVQGDGKKRNDFPGGFAGDPSNKFTAAGRTATENEAFNYVKTLANYRLKSKALTVGSTKDYLPVDGVYVYFRQSGTQTVMCVVNTASETRKLATPRFAESTKGFAKAREVVNGQVQPLGGEWSIPAQTLWVLELTN